MAHGPRLSVSGFPLPASLDAQPRQPKSAGSRQRSFPAPTRLRPPSHALRRLLPLRRRRNRRKNPSNSKNPPLLFLSSLFHYWLLLLFSLRRRASRVVELHCIPGRDISASSASSRGTLLPGILQSSTPPGSRRRRFRPAPRFASPSGWFEPGWRGLVR